MTAVRDQHKERSAHARRAIQAGGEVIDRRVFERLAARLSYVSGDYSEAGTFQRVKELLGAARSPVFYLEIPPSLRDCSRG